MLFFPKNVYADKILTWNWPNGKTAVQMTFDDNGFRKESRVYDENGKYISVSLYATGDNNGLFNNCRKGSFPMGKNLVA